MFSLHDVVIGFRDEAPKGADATLAAKFLASILARKVGDEWVNGILTKKANERLATLTKDASITADSLAVVACAAWIVVVDESELLEIVRDYQDAHAEAA
jgi:hypothetical protein